MGIPVSADDSDIALVDGAYKLLSSPDLVVRDLTWENLSSLVRARSNGSDEPDEMGAFLSGKEYPNTSNPISSIWSKAPMASSRLGVKWSFQHDRSFNICHNNVPIIGRRKVFKLLRASIRKSRFAKLKSLKHQGNTAACVGLSKSSTHFLHSGDFIRFADWRFVNRARLGLVPLNAYNCDAPDSDKKCRRCKAPKETLPHVLNHYRPMLPLCTRRHNMVVERIKEAAKRCWKVVRENQTVAGSSLRPDLLLEKDGHALIIDVTIPFENGPNAFSEAREAKLAKYE